MSILLSTTEEGTMKKAGEPILNTLFCSVLMMVLLLLSSCGLNSLSNESGEDEQAAMSEQFQDKYEDTEKVEEAPVRLAPVLEEGEFIHISIRNASDTEGVGTVADRVLRSYGFTIDNHYKIETFFASDTAQGLNTMILYSDEQYKDMAFSVLAALNTSGHLGNKDEQELLDMVILNPSGENDYLYFSSVLVIIGDDWLR